MMTTIVGLGVVSFMGTSTVGVGEAGRASQESRTPRFIGPWTWFLRHASGQPATRGWQRLPRQA